MVCFYTCRFRVIRPFSGLLDDRLAKACDRIGRCIVKIIKQILVQVCDIGYKVAWDYDRAFAAAQICRR